MRIPLSKPALRKTRRTYENRNDAATRSSAFKKGHCRFRYSARNIWYDMRTAAAINKKYPRVLPNASRLHQNARIRFQSREPEAGNDPYVRQDIREEYGGFAFHASFTSRPNIRSLKRMILARL